jgi:CRISPR-associated endonuclease Csn1
LGFNHPRFTQKLGDAKTKPPLNVSIWKEDFVIKYTLNDSFKEKDVAFIVDDKVRKVVAERFKQCGGDSKKAFREPLYMDDAQKIPITSVRCFTGLSNLIALHDNHDFVVSGNNHHLAIYQNEEGKKDSEIVSFWTAVERKRQGVGVIQNEHPEKGRLIQTFAINDLFIIGLDTTEIDIFEEKNYAQVSKCLYRVQKVSKSSEGAINITFRHHLEAKLDDTSIAKDIKKFYHIRSIPALDEMNGIKVKINNLGKLEKIINNGE